jgi:hypothetical protein
VNLTLVRSSLGPIASEGTLAVGALKLFTLEDRWNDNKPFASCIPVGVYDLVPWDSMKHPLCWAMVNPELNIYRTPERMPVGGRYSCLIHAGNWETDVEGCIAVGLRRGVTRNPKSQRMEPSVHDSQKAMVQLRSVLGRESHTLTITAL